MAKMNMFLHDFSDSFFAIGDTFRNPGFAAEGAGLKWLDYVVANPMWNQDNYDEAFYEADKWERFRSGAPPKSSADWGWAQHILASLDEAGRAAIVLDTGAVSRGSGSKSSNREKVIRRKYVERAWIEGVILLPENQFYNTTAPGIILLLNRYKPDSRKGQLLCSSTLRHISSRRSRRTR
jgi:type I restriction enzyme M protein